MFGHPGLYVADGAIVPKAIGLNPSRTIAALAEHIAAGSCDVVASSVHKGAMADAQAEAAPRAFDEPISESAVVMLRNQMTGVSLSARSEGGNSQSRLTDAGLIRSR